MKNSNVDESKFYHKTNGQFLDTFEALKTYLPEKTFENVRQILYGIKNDEVPLRTETLEAARNKNVEVKQYRVNAEKEELRDPRKVKIAALQNQILLPTTAPVKEQKQALMNRIKEMIEIAALEKANIICLQ